MKYIKAIYEYGIRDEYSKIGVDTFYKKNKSTYINPHLPNIKLSLDWLLSKINITNYIDLAAGNGEVSSYLIKKDIINGFGIDPYLSETYEQNTGKKCLSLSFEDIAVNDLNYKAQTIICSYALHLCEKSHFNNLIYNLSTNCEYFVLISPSKYPIITDDYFELIDSTIINRTHCKIYKSKYYETR